ncbi:MAG: hypothetical protein FJX22_00275 [Alphaproteobacteria bacterium]|nr:hypothetical protein [Alphaproteobacteria bacterium]
MSTAPTTARLWMHSIEVDMRAHSNETLWQFVRDVTDQLGKLPFSNGRSDYHAQIDSMRLNAYLVLLQCEIMRRGHGVSDHPELRGYLKEMQGLRKVVKRLLFSVLPEWTLGLFAQHGSKGHEVAANQNTANHQDYAADAVLAQDLPDLPNLPDLIGDIANDSMPDADIASAMVAAAALQEGDIMDGLSDGLQGDVAGGVKAANNVVKLKRARAARSSR